MSFIQHPSYTPTCTVARIRLMYAIVVDGFVSSEPASPAAFAGREIAVELDDTIVSIPCPPRFVYYVLLSLKHHVFTRRNITGTVQDAVDSIVSSKLQSVVPQQAYGICVWCFSWFVLTRTVQPSAMNLIFLMSSNIWARTSVCCRMFRLLCACLFLFPSPRHRRVG